MLVRIKEAPRRCRDGDAARVASRGWCARARLRIRYTCEWNSRHVAMLARSDSSGYGGRMEERYG